MKFLSFLLFLFIGTISLAQTPKITQGEYFWDTDPGLGLGIPLQALDGNFDTAIEDLFKNGIPTSALSVGAHSFTCRVKGLDGTWSNSFSVTIYVNAPLTTTTRTVKITHGEYFWDTDPGFGLGTPLLALDGNFDTAIEELFKNGIPTSALSVGPHSFTCRVKGLDGTWSNSFSVTIYVNAPLTTTTRTVKIIQGEYFWDTDPGFGLGTPLLALDGNFDTAIEELFKNGIPTSALSVGPHSFTCRVKGLDGTWSNSFSVTIYVNAPLTTTTRTVKIIQGEYFWDTDPGLGLATPLLALDGTFDTAVEEMGSPAVSTTGLSGGAHSLAVRTKGVDGVWSQLFYQTIFINCFTAAVPSVTISASNSSICSVSTVTFTAIPTNGGTAPTYQWKKNGLSVGSSLATYTLSNVANGDIITCQLTSNDVCASPSLAVSNAVTVTINPTVTPAVSISLSAGVTLCAGASVAFTATPTNGGASPIYQWKKNGINVGSGLVTYAASNLANGDVITCHLTSSDVCASPSVALSNAITVTVSPAVPTAISISSAAGTTLCAGASVVFTAIPTNGGASPIYQWKKNGINVGSSSVTYAASNLANGDVITCNLTSSDVCASPSVALSNAVTVTVNPAAPTAISISSSAGTTLCAGTSVVFTAIPNNGGANPIYQWKKNGINVGSGLVTYSPTNLANGDMITCQITSSDACASPSLALSNAVTVTVNPAVTTAISISSSAGATLCAGASVVFTAIPTNGGASPIYQWKKNGINVGSGSVTYAASNLANGDVITCNLTSSNLCASPSVALSNAVTVTVNPAVTTAISISSSAGATLCAGASVVFTAISANGGASPMYQWQKNGINVGSNSVTYAASNLANGDMITCIYTSSNPCATPATIMSNPITIMVNSPTVSIQQTSQTLTATLGFTSYQWSLNGIQISGATSNVHTATLNGLYAVTVTDANGCTATTSLNYFSVGISTMSAQNFNLYPNPSTGNVMISFTDVEDRTIEVVDMLGKLVYRTTSTQQDVLLNLQDLVTSTYTVVITNQNGSKTHVKLVISK